MAYSNGSRYFRVDQSICALVDDRRNSVARVGFEEKIMAYRSQFGLGDTEAVVTKVTYGGEVDPATCIDGYDRYGVACQDWSGLNDPQALAAAKKVFSDSPATTKINPLYIAGALVGLVLVVSMMGGRRR